MANGTGVTHVVSTRPTRRDQGKFLIRGPGSGARLPTSGVGARAEALSDPSKPLIRRHIDGDIGCRDPPRCISSAIPGFLRGPYTLDIQPEYQGVGLAFVSQRGYGRRRWLVLPVKTQDDDGETEEPVALPQLTDEQRAAALEKAAAARRARAKLKDRLKRGGTNLKQVLKDAESDEVLGKMKVSALLEALPKVGKVKAQEIMTELEIAPTRRLRGLGDRQRKALLEKFDFTAD